MTGRRSAGVSVLALASPFALVIALVGCSASPSAAAGSASNAGGATTGAPVVAESSRVGGGVQLNAAGTPGVVSTAASAVKATATAIGAASTAAKATVANPTTSGSRVAPNPAPPAPLAPPALPTTAYVDVSVATLWHSPGSPRTVDQVALRQPAGVRTWLGSMSLAQRRALNGLVDSQLVLGERVVVDKRQGTWVHVVVPDQPTPIDGRGYPGWIPVAQLAFRTPAATGQDAVVVRPTAWVYAPDGVSRVIEVSIGTRLRVSARDSSWVHIELPDGRAAQVHAGDVAVVGTGGSPLPAAAADVVRTAQLFAGTPYLWGGTSGFGFDCSGFTHLVYAMHGATIPRDADAQAVAGIAVARADLRPGDLVFFARNGVVHHVGVYVGNDTMLSSLQTGSPVQLSSLSAQPFASEYSGARRYLP